MAMAMNFMVMRVLVLEVVVVVGCEKCRWRRTIIKGVKLSRR
jgi:hypothetical protein